MVNLLYVFITYPKDEHPISKIVATKVNLKRLTMKSIKHIKIRLPSNIFALNLQKTLGTNAKTTRNERRVQRPPSHGWINPQATYLYRKSAKRLIAEIQSV